MEVLLTGRGGRQCKDGEFIHLCLRSPQGTKDKTNKLIDDNREKNKERTQLVFSVSGSVLSPWRVIIYLILIETS